MDAEKVLDVLREIEWAGSHYEEPACPACGQERGNEHNMLGCELAALLAAAEHEAQTGGWKPGTVPPDDSRIVLVLTEGGRFPGEVPFHIHTGVYGRDTRSDKVSWYANNTRDDVKWWRDLPPLPEQTP